MNTSISTVFVLVIIFHFKHYIADFPLQREYMLRKSLPGWGFLIPLCIHCLVHAGLSLFILLYFAPQLWWLSLVDFGVHFLIDRIKSGPKYLGRFNDLSKPGFWNCLGLDQLLHHVTHLAMIYIMVFPEVVGY